MPPITADVNENDHIIHILDNNSGCRENCSDVVCTTLHEHVYAVKKECLNGLLSGFAGLDKIAWAKNPRCKDISTRRSGFGESYYYRGRCTYLILCNAIWETIASNMIMTASRESFLGFLWSVSSRRAAEHPYTRASSQQPPVSEPETGSPE